MEQKKHNGGSHPQNSLVLTHVPPPRSLEEGGNGLLKGQLQGQLGAHACGVRALAYKMRFIALKSYQMTIYS